MSKKIKIRSTPLTEDQEIERILKQGQFEQTWFLESAMQKGRLDYVKRLLDDPRWDWRDFERIRPGLIASKRQELRDSMIPLLSGIKQSDARKPYYQRTVPAIRKRIAFGNAYERLCADLQQGQVPSIALDELSRLMGLDISGLSGQETCDIIRIKLDQFF